MPKDIHSGKRREGTLDEKIDIIQMRAKGYTWDKIGKESAFGRTRARKIVKIWEDTGTLQGTKGTRSGAPPKLTDSDINNLTKYVEDHPEDTLQEITNASKLNIGVKTVGNKLREKGYWSHASHVEEELEPRHKRDRVQWCTERSRWQEEWKYRIFMDETKLNSSGQDGPRRRVRRQRGTRNQQRYTEKRKHSGRFSLNFWAAITYGAHTPLVFIPRRVGKELLSKKDKGGMTANQYVNAVLEPHLLPWMKQSLGNEGKYHEVIEDLSTPHKAKYTTDWYKQHKIKKSRWPAKSPDLNAIENVWAILKTRVKKHFKDRRPKSQQELINVAKQEWECINWANVDNNIICGSMPRRMQAVLNSDGERTKY